MGSSLPNPFSVRGLEERSAVHTAPALVGSSDSAQPIFSPNKRHLQPGPGLYLGYRRGRSNRTCLEERIIEYRNNEANILPRKRLTWRVNDLERQRWINKRSRLRCKHYHVLSPSPHTFSFPLFFCTDAECVELLIKREEEEESNVDGRRGGTRNTDSHINLVAALQRITVYIWRTEMKSSPG